MIGITLFPRTNCHSESVFHLYVKFSVPLGILKISTYHANTERSLGILPQVFHHKHFTTSISPQAFHHKHFTATISPKAWRRLSRRMLRLFNFYRGGARTTDSPIHSRS
jgi:hypothetical protein